jgi:hypothetical protein
LAHRCQTRVQEAGPENTLGFGKQGADAPRRVTHLLSNLVGCKPADDVHHQYFESPALQTVQRFSNAQIRLNARYCCNGAGLSLA